MGTTMEQALRDSLPQELLAKVDEETWRTIRLHDTEHARDGSIALGTHVMATVKLLSYPFMASEPLLFAMLVTKDNKVLDMILQIAIWTGYLVCQDEIRGRAA